MIASPRGLPWVACMWLGLVSGAGAAATEYEFNKTHTSVRVSWNHWGYSTQSLELTRFDGRVRFDPDQPEGSSVEVTFDLADGIWAGAPEDARFEQHLASPDLLDVAQHPNAQFRSTGVRQVHAGNYRIEGRLTLKGVTHPVVLDARLNKLGEVNGRSRAGFSATAVMDRSAWGLGFGAPDVPHEVTLRIETELVQAPDRARDPDPAEAGQTHDRKAGKNGARVGLSVR